MEMEDLEIEDYLRETNYCSFIRFTLFGTVQLIGVRA